MDDVRESPSLQLVESMQAHLAGVPKCYDPMVSAQIVPGQYRDFDAFLEDIDLMVVMVHHSHLDREAAKVRRKLIFDTRNCGALWSEDNGVYAL